MIRSELQKKLAAAGMDLRHAEAVAIAIAEHQDKLATKSDIEKLESSISSLRTDVKSDMDSFRSEVRSEMKTQFRWLMTMQFAS